MPVGLYLGREISEPKATNNIRISRTDQQLWEVFYASSRKKNTFLGSNKEMWKCQTGNLDYRGKKFKQIMILLFFRCFYDPT